MQSQGPLSPGARWLVNVGAIRNGSFSHEHNPSSPSKTVRAAMGCSVRFAGDPIRTKERRIEGLAGQRRAARGKSPRKTRRAETAGFLTQYTLAGPWELSTIASTIAVGG